MHCSSLMELLHCVWDSPPPTLHMARQDMELTGILRRTVENAASAVTNVRTLPCSILIHHSQTIHVPVPCYTSFQYDSCRTSTQAKGIVKSYLTNGHHPHSMHIPPTLLPQIKRTAVLRHKQFKEKQLRSRQRANYEHLLKRWVHWLP